MGLGWGANMRLAACDSEKEKDPRSRAFAKASARHASEGGAPRKLSVGRCGKLIAFDFAFWENVRALWPFDAAVASRLCGEFALKILAGCKYSPHPFFQNGLQVQPAPEEVTHGYGSSVGTIGS